MKHEESIKPKLFLAINSLLWFMLFVLESLQDYSLYQTSIVRGSLSSVIWGNATFYLGLWFLAFLIYWVWKKSKDLDLYRQVGIHTGSALVFGFLHLLVYRLMHYMILVQFELVSFDAGMGQIFRNVVQTRFPELIRGSLMYAVVVIILYGLNYYRNYQTQQTLTAEMETRLMRSQLEMLRTQLRPHFFFNVLNTISMMIRDGMEEEALEMISRLGELLRTTLHRSEKEFIPFGRELELVKTYLEIESIRFQDQLTVRYRVEKESLDVMVPSLVLLTVVENAIKHGVSKRMSESEIVITAAVDESRLILTVYNDGPVLEAGFDPEAQAGFGLKNMVERLSRLNGGYELDIYNRNRGIEVQLAVPVHKPAGDIT